MRTLLLMTACAGWVGVSACATSTGPRTDSATTETTGTATNSTTTSTQPGGPAKANDANKLTADDFKVREVKSVEAPTYLAGIDEKAQDLFRQGVLAVTSDPPDMKAGASFFQEAVAKDTKFLEAYFNLGMSLERMGERNDALDVYRSALDRNPNDPTASAYIAKLYLGKARQAGLKGNFEARTDWLGQAKALLDKLADTPTGSDVAVNNALALYHLAKDEVAPAEKFVKEVLYADPTNVTGLNTRGLINLKHKKYLIAQYIFNKVLSLDPQSTEALTNLGYTMVVIGKRKKAMELFQRALKTDVTNMDVRMNIAALLLEHLHYDRAYAEYRRVLEAEPLNLEAQEGVCDSSFGLAGTANDQKAQYEIAMGCYETFIGKRPERTDLWERIAKTYQIRLQDFDNAVKYYEIYLAKAKLTPEKSTKVAKLVKSLKDIIAQGGLKAMMEPSSDEEGDDDSDSEDEEQGDSDESDAPATDTTEPAPADETAAEETEKAETPPPAPETK